ncbi:MAG: transporter [Chlamydiales bacterium]|nr:transporter [Chlamydiales bacterium]
MKSILAGLVILPSFLIADQGYQKTPEEIEQELSYDEKLFKEAQEMFNPWYAGPLLTGGAHMMAPGSALIQPYVFVTDNYAVWDEDRKTVDTPSRVNFNPSISPFQFGITDWLDMSISIQGDVNWQRHKHSGGFGDSSISLGFPIMVEGLHTPAIKATFTETFPTGRYQRLSPHKLGLDSTGGGSYQSAFGLRISKLVFWSFKHPMNLRATYTYTVPSRVEVHGFNSYGGGYGTRGKVNPGNNSSANAAFEYSFTQRWVFATDLVYVWANKTTFSGKRGRNADGTVAKVGGGSSDQLSLAPALEYNPSPNLNFIGGVWFDVYGRNTSKFISGILSVSYVFNW